MSFSGESSEICFAFFAAFAAFASWFLSLIHILGDDVMDNLGVVHLIQTESQL